EVVGVSAARLEGGIVARRGDTVGRVVGGEFLEFGGYEVLEPGERRGAALLEGGVVLADFLVGSIVAVQQQGELEAEPVNAGGVDVYGRGADGEFDEVVVRTVGCAEVEVHAAGRVRGHVDVGLLCDGFGLPVEAPVDLAVGVLAVGLVDDRDLQDVGGGGDGAGVAPERGGRLTGTGPGTGTDGPGERGGPGGAGGVGGGHGDRGGA